MDQQGNITDKAFVTEIGKILQQTQIGITKISVEHFDALPDKLDSFKARFIDNDGIMKNGNLEFFLTSIGDEYVEKAVFLSNKIEKVAVKKLSD